MVGDDDVAAAVAAPGFRTVRLRLHHLAMVASGGHCQDDSHQDDALAAGAPETDLEELMFGEHSRSDRERPVERRSSMALPQGPKPGRLLGLDARGHVSVRLLVLRRLRVATEHTGDDLVHQLLRR